MRNHESSGADQLPIEIVYERHFPQVVRFFLSKGLQRDAADDLGQEVFYRLLRSGKSLNDEAYTKNLVFCIAQNLLIDYFRKNNGAVRERAGTEEDIASEDRLESACYDSPEVAFISSETSQDIRRVMAGLPERHARALELREFEGLSYREMAQQMGMSEKAAESLLHRARMQLKTDLAAAGTQRGGWWSIFPVTAGVLKKAFPARLVSAPRAIYSRIASGVASLSGAGLGHSAATFLVALLIAASAVGVGVAAKAVDHAVRPQGPSRDGVESAPAVTETPGIRGVEADAEAARAPDGQTSTGPETDPDSPPDAPEEKVPAVVPPASDGPGPVADLVDQTGTVLELVTSELGRQLTAIADPLLDLLGTMGLPSEMSDLVRDAVGLGLVMDLESVAIEDCVAAAGLVDGALTPLVPGATQTPDAGSPAVVAPVTQPDGSASPQPVPAVAPDPAPSPPKTEPVVQDPETDEEPVVEPEPAPVAPDPDQGPPPELVEEVVEDVVDVLDDLL